MNKHLTLLLFIGLAWGRTTVAIFDFENNGLNRGWYENGQKKSEGIFKDGELISEKKWNEDGSVKND